MDKEVKDFLKTTNKKLAMIEKKIQEMKLNIVVMSFYSDLKLIEDTLYSYEVQGIRIDESLFEKIDEFKILLQSRQNLSTLGKKFLEVTEEFYKIRKQVFGKNDSKIGVKKTRSKHKITKSANKDLKEFLSAYV